MIFEVYEVGLEVFLYVVLGFRGLSFLGCLFFGVG